MVTEIRPALDADLDLLAPIEDAADRLFLERFRPERWDAAPSGRARAAEAGFLLVIAEHPSGPAVGFVHVLEHDGAHLEQLAVHPDAARRGHGRALVEAALAEAGRRGHRRMTLRTYADVPWNAPFYAAVGFAESAPDTAFLLDLVEEESRLGLARYGRRVQMTASIDVPGPR